MNCSAGSHNGLLYVYNGLLYVYNGLLYVYNGLLYVYAGHCAVFSCAAECSWFCLLHTRCGLSMRACQTGRTIGTSPVHSCMPAWQSKGYLPHSHWALCHSCMPASQGKGYSSTLQSADQHRTMNTAHAADAWCPPPPCAIGQDLTHAAVNDQGCTAVPMPLRHPKRGMARLIVDLMFLLLSASVCVRVMCESCRHCCHASCHSDVTITERRLGLRRLWG
jgi:hypothetical protein